MNPQYKEITYHQLMKKIEILNELALEEGFLDSAKEYLLGNRKKREGQEAIQGAAITTANNTNNSSKTYNTATTASNATKTQQDATVNAANAAADKIENDKRSEFIRSKAADELFRLNPTPENQAKSKAARAALRITPLTKDTPKQNTAHDPLQPVLSDEEMEKERLKIVNANPVDAEKKNLLSRMIGGIGTGIKREIQTRTYLPIFPHEKDKCAQLQNALTQAVKNGNSQAILLAKKAFQKDCE